VRLGVRASAARYLRRNADINLAPGASVPSHLLPRDNTRRRRKPRKKRAPADSLGDNLADVVARAKPGTASGSDEDEVRYTVRHNTARYKYHT
jgi:hypothetical protein